jgi:hypothetical protein
MRLSLHQSMIGADELIIAHVVENRSYKALLDRRQ